MCPSSSTIIPYTYERGFKKKKVYIAKIFSILSLLFVLGYYLGTFLTPSPKFCPSEEPCTRPDLFAIEFVCLSCFLYMSYNSILFWQVRQVQRKEFPATTLGRVFSLHTQSQNMTAFSLVFQGWDLLVTPFIPEFATPIMLLHHVLAAFVSYVALEYQIFNYYAMFYFALSEVSSIPLVVLSLSKYYPPQEGSLLEMLKGLAEPLFAITFSYYRVFLWTQITYKLWQDGIYVIRMKLVDSYRPGKTWTLYVILFSALILSFMQFYWFTLVLSAVMATLTGSATHEVTT
jgi:hypothetical protein